LKGVFPNKIVLFA